jgi:hypothetical protein
MRKHMILLLATVVTTDIKAEIDTSAITKLETTAAKIRTAKIFLSDETIKKRIMRSMIKDPDKWRQARAQYINVVTTLQSHGVRVDAPSTLDELMRERAHLDADKILLQLARQIKHHST